MNGVNSNDPLVRPGLPYTMLIVPAGWRESVNSRSPEAERFWAKVVSEDGCLIWTGAKISTGYGQFWSTGADGTSKLVVKAHRWAYEHLVGPIPPGQNLDHLCRRRACVAPEHLEPVTQRENVVRGFSPNAAKTHCPRGHPLSGDNLYINPDGFRKCRECERERKRRYKARLRAIRTAKPH